MRRTWRDEHSATIEQASVAVDTAAAVQEALNDFIADIREDTRKPVQMTNMELTIGFEGFTTRNFAGQLVREVATVQVDLMYSEEDDE